jgi:hypothetical protein
MRFYNKLSAAIFHNLTSQVCHCVCISLKDSSLNLLILINIITFNRDNAIEVEIHKIV